ncbi:MAG: hypothetical protein ACRDVG_02570 [Jatrophihabitantaceae bacterium]
MRKTVAASSIAIGSMMVMSCAVIAMAAVTATVGCLQADGVRRRGLHTGDVTELVGATSASVVAIRTRPVRLDPERE